MTLVTELNITFIIISSLTVETSIYDVKNPSIKSNVTLTINYSTNFYITHTIYFNALNIFQNVF